MSEIRTCAFRLSGWNCPRPIWEKGDSDEKYCLFHSNNINEKREEFIKEINSIEIGSSSTLYHMGMRKAYIFGDFLGFHFPKNTAHFKKHKFPNNVSFEHVMIEGDVDLSSSIVLGYLSFTSANIKGNVNLDNSDIKGYLAFTSVNINGSINLNFAKIGRFLVISESKINELSSWYVNINENIEIQITEIVHVTSFRNAIIGGSVELFNIFSTNQIDLYEALIKGGLLINDTFVEHNVIISRCKCMDNLLIKNTKLRLIEADNFKYKGVFSVCSVEFINQEDECFTNLSNVDLEKARFIGSDLSTIAFGGAFIREVIFDRVTFGKATESKHFWEEPWYCGRPNEAIFEERIARYKREDDLERADLFKSAETVYRTLKHAMEEQHAHNLARRLRAGELEMQYQVMELEKPKPWWKPKNLWRRFRIWAKQQPIGSYRFLNGYGLHWIRTLVLWLVCVFSFAFFGYQGQEATYEKFDLAQQQHVVMAKRVNLPEAIWHSLEMTSIIASPSLHIENPGIRWVEGLEKFLSPVLLLLFLQAARNAARD